MNYDYQFQNDNGGNNGGMPPVNLGGTPAKNGHGMALASLILSIVSVALLFFGCCCINLVPAILAIVFSAISAKRDGKMSVLAIVGLVIAIICIVLTLVLLGFIIYIGMEMVNNPDGEIMQALERAFDEPFRQRYGMSFREYIDQIMGEANALE